MTDPLNRTTTFAYDAAGRQILVTSPGGRQSATSYDDAGQVVAQTQAPGTADEASSTMTYDADGRVLTQTDAAGTVTTFTYNARGEQSTVADALGHTQTFTYDSRGLPTGTVNADATTTARTYNAAGRLISQRDEKNDTRTFAYTARGQLATLTDARASVTGWSYDLAGRLLRKTYHDGTHVDYTYDAAGRLATRQWARGVTTTYAYNLRDQVTGMTYSDGTPAVTMSYDAAGRPLEIGNAVATDAYAYDDAGQLAVETQSVAGHPAAMRTLTHSHDADGLRTGLVYPGGKVLAAGYTARGQLATMTFHGQPVATSTYRPNGQPIGTVYGNGAQRTLSYDAAGRLTGTGTNVGAATITGRGYALDAVGRRTGYVDETAANAVFSYDPAGQVLGGTVPVPGQPASVNTYAYDPEGNRTQSSTGIQPAPADPVTITGSTTYTANPLNQYTAITGNPNPTYDADGNLLSGLRSPLSVFTSTWNGENRMLSSTSANVAITDRRVENAYDALGRRVRKTVKFASTGAVIEDRYFIYDGWNVIEETIAPATGPVETAEAVWGTDLSGSAQGAGGVGGLLLRESSANGASYYHYDGNGNVTALTSAAGVVQAAYTYGPFGETLRAAGPLAQANPWRFSTKYQDDETGLLYYGYRFYNPTDGRWPNRDPIQERGGDNLYGFCFNNGNAWIDILGREPGWPMGLVWQNGQMTYDPYSNPLHNFTPPAWQRSADGEVTVNKCHIVIFLGHNNSVPQGKIRNAPCSAAHVISCGGAGVYNPGQPEIPIPGAPGNLKSKDNDAISLEIAKRMLVRSLNAAKKMANTICGDKMKCCTEVAIDVESSLGFVSRGLFPGGSGPWHIVIPCKR